VHGAIDHGVKLVDTAPFYGDTKAGAVPGKALRDISRERYHLATNFGRGGPTTPAGFDYSAARVAASVDEIIHETIPLRRRIQAAGRVRMIGIAGR
jgi:L-galactose dehydrogenase